MGRTSMHLQWGKSPRTCDRQTPCKTPCRFGPCSLTRHCRLQACCRPHAAADLTRICPGLQDWIQHLRGRADTRLETVGAPPSTNWPYCRRCSTFTYLHLYLLRHSIHGNGTHMTEHCDRVQARLLCGNSEQITKLISSGTSAPPTSIDR